MSGSSLDGLDACLAQFEKTGETWTYRILESATFPLPVDLVHELRASPELNALGLLTLNVAYGKWIAKTITALAARAELISLHGHTVFHSPGDNVSLQIGSGEVVNLLTSKPVVAQFRNTDIFLGGQGAPLVPMGEKMLFPSYDSFLNLGGICNASFTISGNWIAGDIGPFNQVFNHYAATVGLPMDTDGEMARSGKRMADLMHNWGEINYFKQPFPKSLANQWVSGHFLNITNVPPADILHSFAHFITDQISNVINGYSPKRLLITGGGAFNSYLISLLREKCRTELHLPDSQLIECKEALIFGFLGLLRARHEVNVLASCTGANRDSSSGVIYQ